MTITAVALERIDTWVLTFSIAIPLVFLAVLGLWYLFAFLTARERKPVRESPEPPQLSAQVKDDPERLERTCAAHVESLAAMYLELAESWARKGQTERVTAALQQLVQRCPETRQAQIARERLGQFRTPP